MIHSNSGLLAMAWVAAAAAYRHLLTAEKATITKALDSGDNCRFLEAACHAACIADVAMSSES